MSGYTNESDEPQSEENVEQPKPLLDEDVYPNPPSTDPRATHVSETEEEEEIRKEEGEANADENIE